MPTTPEMLRLATQFRQALLSRERQVSVTLLRRYGTIWRGLSQQATALQAEMDARRQAGEEISQGMLWREQRIKALQRQVRSEMVTLADGAADLISQAELDAIEAGGRDAYQLTLAGMPEQAGFMVQWNRLPTPAIESLVGTLQDGSPLNELIRQAVGGAADDFMDQLVIGLASGWNPRKMARVLRGKFGMGLTRAMQISRTEMLRAYRTATLYQYQQSDVVTAWERHVAKDNRTCMACIMLDGTIYTTEQAMDDHVNGRCAMLPVTKTWRELGFDIDEPDFTQQRAQDWFLEQDDATQQQMMGIGKWEAWKAGQFDLEDLPKRIPSAVWGDSWVPKSLKELTEAAEVTE